MKKILLSYYSRRNFGDDLFVKIFCQYFSDCQIYFLGNPIYTPANLGKNTRIHLCAWLATVTGKMQGIFQSNKKVAQFLQRTYDWLQIVAEKNMDACVTIGGSIFPDYKIANGTVKEQKDFSLPPELARDFGLASYKRESGNRFVIGANLGPVYNDDYFSRMDKTFSSYAHVCLRDYASYFPFRENPHVQYAPDVVFMYKPSENGINEENRKRALISVMDISRHTSNQKTVENYYNVMKKTIEKLQEDGMDITLLSLCEREGDSAAVQTLLQKLDSAECVDIHIYSGDLEKTIHLFEQSAFVIATRFHSMIMGFVCEKPVFPIIYGCKTAHYLQDLAFQGKVATMDALENVTVDDVLYNYKNQILCSCENHRQFAPVQFEILKQYLTE